jgi:hypothetical protein
MSPEEKLLTLASMNSQLQADLGTSPFRWYDQQLVQGTTISANGFPAVRFSRVSTDFYYEMAGRNPMDAIRMQLDVLHPVAETARLVADHIIAFLASVSLAQSNEFDSPATVPPQFPTYILNRRETVDPRLQPLVKVVMLDLRLYNLEDY